MQKKQLLFLAFVALPALSACNQSVEPVPTRLGGTVSELVDKVDKFGENRIVNEFVKRGEETIEPLFSIISNPTFVRQDDKVNIAIPADSPARSIAVKSLQKLKPFHQGKVDKLCHRYTNHFREMRKELSLIHI